MSYPLQQAVRLAQGIASIAFVGSMSMLLGQEPVQPLKPLDRSSPRAALRTFLDSVDRLGAFLENEYLESPSRADFSRAVELSDIAVESLDLSKIPQAARNRAGRAAALELYETLNRIPLPPWESIPGEAAIKGDASDPIYWTIPDTEIVLEGKTDSNGERRFLFNPETVERAEQFYRKVKDLPYQRDVPLGNLGWILATTGGWLIPYSWVLALPDWLQQPVWGQATWKWILFILIVSIAVLLFRRVYLFSRWKSDDHPVLESLVRLALPTSVLVITPVVFYLTRVQLKFVGS